MYNSREGIKEKQLAKDNNGGVMPPEEDIKVTKATWMADGTHWPGTWYSGGADHKKSDHAGILQVTVTKKLENLKTNCWNNYKIHYN